MAKNQSGAVCFTVSAEPIGSTGENEIEVTTELSNLVLFKNKGPQGTMSYRVLVNGSWFYLRELTYNNLMGLIMEG